MQEKWKDRLIMLKYVLGFWLTVSLVSGTFSAIVAAYYIKAASTTTNIDLFLLASSLLLYCLGAGCLLGVALWFYLVITKRQAPEVMHQLVRDLADLGQNLTTKRKDEKR